MRLNYFFFFSPGALLWYKPDAVSVFVSDGSSVEKINHVPFGVSNTNLISECLVNGNDFSALSSDLLFSMIPKWSKVKCYEVSEVFDVFNKTVGSICK